MKRKLILFIATLLFSSSIYAQDFHFAPDFDYHDYTMLYSVIGQVYFNGEKQNSDQVEVACFVGDECRGRVKLMEPFPNVPDLGYFAYLPCYYNNVGETYTFKAYDHATGIEYVICEETVVGNEDGYGDVDDPYDLHFTREEEPNVGPEYPWVPSTAYSGNGMMVTAQIQINGQLVDRATYEVGAFCGEECRGTSSGGRDDEDGLLVDFTEDGLGYFAFMNIMGNDGDIINFYLYDKESQSIFQGVCATTVELENDGELGTDIYGGDIFVLNFVEPVEEQTFTKHIEAWTEDGGYYLIASPIGDVEIENVGNLITNNFDFYYFDQSQEMEWMNYHQGEGSPALFNSLVSGKGYLYASQDSTTLTFTGVPYSGNGEVTITKDANAELSGWNLVGNPFAQRAYVTRLFYTLNDSGSELIPVRSYSVEAMEGIFVLAQSEEDNIMTFSTEMPSKVEGQIVLNVTHGRGYAMDRAIVRFGEGDMLPKFMLNQSNTKVYIPQDGSDFAVVRSTEAGELPVNFKAAQNGTYTINVSAEEVGMNYLHLIDNMTGTDVNLLQTPSYSFNALTTDYESRFKLVFATGANNEDAFSFYSNGNWFINNDGDATLQVIDVTGRILSSEEISGCFSKHIEAAPGVYMLRLINGNDMKVQKIVVGQ